MWTPPRNPHPHLLRNRKYDARPSNIPKLPKFAVVGLFGPAGSGKSLFAAVLAEREWQKAQKAGRPRKLLYFPQDFKHIHGEPVSLAQMLTGDAVMDGAIMVWDEAHVLLNKFKAASHANRSTLGFLSQIRKRGCTLFYTTNSPKQLDRALAEQTTAHCYLEMHEDPRCKPFDGAHTRGCSDGILHTWVDTQGKHGFDSRYRDNRKRKRQKLPYIHRFYGLYNTFATVSVEEVGQMDKNAIAAAHDEKSLGTNFTDFVERMYGWLDELIQEHGAAWLAPARFAEFISKQTDGEITPSEHTVGRACKQMGLARKRESGGVKYKLPSKEELHLFRVGLA